MERWVGGWEEVDPHGLGGLGRRWVGGWVGGTYPDLAGDGGGEGDDADDGEDGDGGDHDLGGGGWVGGWVGGFIGR